MEHTLPEKSPPLFRYSLVLPAAALGAGYTAKALFPGAKPSSIGFIPVMLLALWLICIHFGKHFARQFSSSERLRLFWYFMLWALALEALGALAYDGSWSLSDLLWIGVPVMLLHAVVIGVGVYFVATKFLDRNLKTNASSVT